MDALWSSPLAPLVFVAFFGAVGTLLYPLMQGLRRRIEGDGGTDVSQLREEVDALRAEVAHLRATQAGGVPHERLVDLEERLDFAERLIASGRNEPLPGGH
jgi:hypothetical protein